MIRNYLKIALRVIIRQKLFAAINIFGLSIGLASAMLLFFFVDHELSYDKSFSNSEKIYRVYLNLNVDDGAKSVAVTPKIIGPVFKEEIPEVENYVRMLGASLFNKIVIQKGEDYFEEDNVFFADSTMFDLFDVDILAGRKEDLLSGPNKVALSRSTAKRYFGNETGLGQTLKRGDLILEVSGIFEDFPTSTHMHPEILISFSSLPDSKSTSWDNANDYTYLLLNSPESRKSVQGKIDQISEDNLPDKMKAVGFTFHLEPLCDIHLLSNAEFSPEAGGDIRYVYAFIAIAIFIILIATFNYMNLSTAKSAERAKEVGMRKVMGAYRSQLIFQFIGESLVITIFSILLAVGIVELVKQYFFNLIEQDLNMSLLTNARFWGVLLFGSLIISIISAFYPAMTLSAYKPSSILRGGSKKSGGKSTLRKGLVILQFTISSALILGTFVVFKQLTFMQQKKLGFNQEQVIIIQTTSDELHDKAEAIRSTLTSHSNILEVSSSSAYPGRNSGGQLFNAEGMEESEQATVWQWRVNEHFVNSMGFELIYGRDFQPSDRESENMGFIINQTAVSSFGWEENDCIGKTLTSGSGAGRCIGVLKDFHYTSLKDQVEPLALCMRDGFHKYFVIKIGTGKITGTIDFIESQWKGLANNEPFSYYFLDQDFGRLYNNEKKVSQVFLIFALLTIFIACLGLFGLSSFAAVQRTKEIGIRKAMGSTVSGIIVLFLKDNLKFILSSLVFAIPISYFMMKKWLEGFAYKTAIGLDVVIVAISVVLFIAILTVSFHAIKAANTNPADSLRNE